ncbi:MAG: hypothetical protein ACK5B9_03870 [Flavobacteriia bacterium]
MGNKKHIVLIAAWFYPVNKVASFRINAFAKYLNKEKYDVTVIAYNDDNLAPNETIYDGVNVYREKCTSLFQVRRQKVGENWFTHNLKSLNNKIVLYFSKEDYPGWSNSVLKRLLSINDKQKIDCIISTFAPVDSHIAAMNFKMKYPDIKWIADMRDEMSSNNLISEKDRLKLSFWESQFQQYTDALVTVSAPILNNFKTHFIREEILFREIRNGFDHDLKPLNNFNDCFTFLYAGTFYGKRKPDTFFQALVEMKNEGKLNCIWQIRLLGTHQNFDIPAEIKSNITIVPEKNNSEALTEMFQADCNLLIHPPTGVKGVYTGKLFEYISANKPILALVDKSDVAAELIAEFDSGISVDFYDIEEIKFAIAKIVEQWSNRMVRSYDQNKVFSLHRKNQTKELENLIEEIGHA